MFKNYFKIAWRSLLKRKGFALINIMGLALGFGCGALIYLFIQHHLQYDDFHANADRIYRFNTEEHRDMIDYEGSVPPGFGNTFKNEFDYAELVAKIIDWEEELITVENSSEPLKFIEDVAFAEQDFFRIFNFKLSNGGIPNIEEPNTAVITPALARKIFGPENPVNKTFTLGGTEVIRVTGVLADPPSPSLFKPEAYISYVTADKFNPFYTSETWGGNSSSLQTFALLRPDQDIAAIEKAISAYPDRFRPNSKNVHVYQLQNFQDIHFNPQFQGGMDGKTLWIFGLIGLFILIIASINFINISTAQATNRSREIGVRKVLGGYKLQLFWQFMAETFIITLAALILGILFTGLTLPSFNSVFGLDLSLMGLFNFRFALFIGLLLILVTFMAGSYPGILLAKIRPVLALKQKLSQKDAGGIMTRRTLVIAQFTISIMLIIATAIVGKQLRYALHSDLGFEQEGIVMVNIPEDLETVQINGLKERFLQHSAVENVTACFASPGAGRNNWGTGVRYNQKPENEDFNLQVKVGDENYFNTFDLELVAGKSFIVKDTIDESVVNETFVRKVGLQHPEEILNKEIEVNGGMIRTRIVGVVKDFHNNDFHEAIDAVFIAPVNTLYSEFALKINLNQTREALLHIEKEWKQTFPEQLFTYNFLDDRVASLYETEQRFLSLIAVFSGIAIFIGCLGIYGLILFFVNQKTKEIGIRKVMGSQAWEILILVTRDFLKLIVLAGIIAIPVSWYFMNRWLEGFQYRTDLSWWVFISAIVLVLVITFITISYQALKAAYANPVKSLRTE